MRELWNEGRVVGFSAYEVYMRSVLTQDPDATPATEKEWLSSTIAMGSSMLLRVGEDTQSGMHYIEVPFPNNSRLCAANTIIASIFLGEGAVSGDANATGWASKVINYGPLIYNTSESSPSGTTVPPTNPSSTQLAVDYADYVDQIKNYMLITDGIVIQPGTWTVSGTTPYKDFSPTLTQAPKLRIALADKVTTPFFILLTGFTNRDVISGTSGFSSAITTNSPADGDYLGPWEFPWSAKILFNVSPGMLQYLDNTIYTRKIPADGAAETVNATPIIDMQTTDPYDYYQNHSTYESAVKDTYITDIKVSKDYASIITVLQNHEDLPPALYGMLLENEDIGTWHLSPLDVVAPGSNKIYDVFYNVSDIAASSSSILTYEGNTVGTVGFIRDIGKASDQEHYPATYILYQHDKETDSIIPVAKTDKTNLFGMLTVRELKYSDGSVIGPILYVEGTSPSQYIHTFDSSGNPITPAQAWDMADPSGWRLTVDEPLKSVLPAAEKAELTTNGYISGTTAKNNPLPYDSVSVMNWKRITGKMSDIIQSQCGYEYYIDGALNPVFAPGGFWAGVTKTLAEQIPAGEEEDYYIIIPGDVVSNQAIWPVKKSDQTIDITIRFGYDIIAHDNYIQLAGFKNDMTEGMNSALLGSWWGASNIDPVTGMSSTYNNGWAKIYMEDSGTPVLHPVVDTVVPDNSTGQVYFGDAMLPVSGTYSTTIRNIFGVDFLEANGISSAYYDYPLRQFLEVALYTDVGTGELLSPTSANIKQPIQICYSTTSTPINRAFTLNVANSASTTGKTQLMTIPTQFQDTSNYPVGTVIETGREKAVALSMLDSEGTPYPLDGASGTETVPDTGLTWTNLINALYQDKAIDILGQILISIRTHITGVGDNYIEFNNGGTPIRLYVANSEPSAANIPEGSVGIGWSGIKIYHSGAWSS